MSRITDMSLAVVPISMCVAFVGLCLFKEPLLCSRCSTAMHLELPQMFTVLLTTLLAVCDRDIFIFYLCEKDL